MSVKIVRLTFVCFVVNCTKVSIFHPLEAVGRGSETQLEVGEKLNSIT